MPAPGDVKINTIMYDKVEADGSTIKSNTITLGADSGRILKTEISMSGGARKSNSLDSNMGKMKMKTKKGGKRRMRKSKKSKKSMK
jgi:hypothetical protein